MAQTGKMQTYEEVLDTLISESVKLPSELLAEVEEFVKKNKELGFVTREEFLRDAIRFRLEWLSGKKEYLAIPREQYLQLERALKEMGLPYCNVRDFINTKIAEALNECAKQKCKE